MKRRGKIIATITTMCLALVMLTFGVLAATTVSFNIGGTVSYKVDDVLCRINTQLYYSKNNTVLKYADAYNAGYDLSQAETLPQDIEEAPEEYFTGKEIKTYNKETGAIVQLTEQDLIFDDILLPLGRYDESSDEVKSYKYYLVIEVENYGENNITVAVTDNTTVENASKLTNLQRDITNNGVSIAKDETKKVVVAFSLQDVTEGISSTEFSYSVLVEEKEEEVVTTATIDTLDGDTLTQVQTNFTSSAIIEEIICNKENVLEGVDAVKINLTLSNIPDDKETIVISTSDVTIGLYKHCDTASEAYNTIDEYMTEDQMENISVDGAFDLSKKDENNSVDICLLIVFTQTIEEDVISIDVTLSYPSDEREVSKFLYSYSNGEYSISANTVYFSENENVTIEEADILPYSVHSDGRAYNVTNIGGFAFGGITNLTSIIIPRFISSIKSEAFELCTSLTSITIPDTVTYIGWGAFGEWTAEQSIYFEGTSMPENLDEDWNNLCDAKIYLNGELWTGA